jgi:hypothetical protein
MACGSVEENVSAEVCAGHNSPALITSVDVTEESAFTLSESVSEPLFGVL